MPTLIDNGARNKLQNLLRIIEARVPDFLSEVGAAIAQDAASRAPSPVFEETTMMYGGNTGLSPGDDSRLRFIKPEQNFLRNFIARSFRVDGLSLGIGDVTRLEEISSYEYTNKDGTTHIVTYPFWMSWEFGGIFTITPRSKGNARGRGYPLMPTPFDPMWKMVKAIPPRYMYSGVEYEPFIDGMLIPRIKKLVSQL